MELEELWVYRLSMELAKDIYRIVVPWSFFDRDSLGMQLVRAADSAPLNLAEGYGRYSSGDNKRFILYARGSLFEVRAQLELAFDRKLLSQAQYDDLTERVTVLIKGVIAYSKSMSKVKAT